MNQEIKLGRTRLSMGNDGFLYVEGELGEEQPKAGDIVVLEVLTVIPPEAGSNVRLRIKPRIIRGE